ncbi:uncharacterized membrane protein YoaK (UPF0700 family) [Mycetocola sp. BIGb0189]|uniref:YoaK family protein n=1 Tax=Mycetocola sp. BIGb0189 TaxID=2940604 RepID=UPI002169C970|nr:YoaK family protein [Mycetocola sp. BIGb0189]MCS4276322.1 uncharacterized membrane protein YoaK (UPF0700 family) [Mycetocola sp. BIGb0189]
MSATNATALPPARFSLAGPKFGTALPVLLLVLTAVTGIVDAISVLELGRVFVANMTGNVVSIGFALAGAPHFSLTGSIFALAGYILGAGLGGYVMARIHLAPVRAFRNVMGVVVLAFAGVVAMAWITGAEAPMIQHIMVALMATALGVQGAAARALGVPDLSTTVLTMTITGLVADIWGGKSGALTRRILAVAAMLIGAFTGGVLVLNAGIPVALSVVLLIQIVVLVSMWDLARKS